jgi:hypothetical protein
MPGAKRGANGGGSRATLSHDQPLPVQLNATSGHTGHHLPTLGECLPSRRSGGSGLPGACDDRLFCVPGTGR